MSEAVLAGQIRRLSLRGVNAYVVDDGELTLIDAGTPWDGGRIRDALAASNYALEDVDRVLVTHYDLDHVGTLADLDAPVYLAEPDASYLDGTRSPPLSNHKGALQRVARFLLDPPAGNIHRIGDGEAIGGFTAIRAPGHTPGHTVYVHEELGAAFLGDMVRGEDGTLALPPWLVTADPAENRRSVRLVADRAPPFEVAAMGHGVPIREGGRTALQRLVTSLY